MPEGPFRRAPVYEEVRPHYPDARDPRVDPRTHAREVPVYEQHWSPERAQTGSAGR